MSFYVNRQLCRLASTAGLSVFAACLLGTSAQAQTQGVPATEWIEQFLIVGMQSSENGDAVDVQNTELGANRQLLSDGSTVKNSWDHAGPNTRDVFSERWEKSGGSETAPPAGAANIFEGVDWSGNVAITSDDGRFSMSDIDLFADQGVLCATGSKSSCRQSVSNTRYFADGQGPRKREASGLVDNNVGISLFDSTALLNELTDWKTFINELEAEYSITENIENQNGKDGSGPFVTDLDALDVDNDGLVVIDINIDGGNSDFELNNSDWILQGSADTKAIFRIQGESNFNLSNSSILLGDGGIGRDEADYVNQLGAIFVKSDDGEDSSDSVFNFDNAVLNGIGIWDLVKVGNQGKTEININNGQGCAQFIGSKVNFNDVRWNKCSGFNLAARIADEPEREQLPEPSALIGLAMVGAFSVQKYRQRRAASLSAEV